MQKKNNNAPLTFYLSIGVGCVMQLRYEETVEMYRIGIISLYSSVEFFSRHYSYLRKPGC